MTMPNDDLRQCIARGMQGVWDRQRDLPPIEFTQEETREIAAELVNALASEGWQVVKIPQGEGRPHVVYDLPSAGGEG